MPSTTIVILKTMTSAPSLTARWANAGRFPLKLGSGESLRLRLELGPGVTQGRVTRIERTTTGGDVEISALPSAEPAITNTNRSGAKETFSFSVAGTAIVDGQVLSWNSDPELILRTGMEGR